MALKVQMNTAPVTEQTFFYNQQQKGKKMKKKLLTVAMMISILFCMTACGGRYYKVKDLHTDKTYYTQNIEQGKSGAVTFEDPQTESVLTIQNSEITKINKEEFKANTPKEK